MSAHRQLTAVALVALGALLTVVLTGETSPGQPPAAPPPEPQGRYQMAVVGTGTSSVFICDTHTGQVWYRQTYIKSEWNDLGSPASETPPEPRRPR